MFPRVENGVTQFLPEKKPQLYIRNSSFQSGIFISTYCSGKTNLGGGV